MVYLDGAKGSSPGEYSGEFLGMFTSSHAHYNCSSVEGAWVKGQGDLIALLG